MSQAALITALRQALALDSTNGPLWAHLAELLVREADEPAALEALRKAIELGQTQPAVMVSFISLLRRTGAMSEALIRAEEAVAKSSNPALRCELARILLAREDLPAARRQYEQATMDDPGLRDSLLAQQLGLPPESPADPLPMATAESILPPPPLPAFMKDHDPFDPDDYDDDLELDDEDEDDDDSLDPEEELLALLANATDEPSLDDFDWAHDEVTFKDVVGLDDVKRQIHLRIIAPFKQQDIFKAFSRKAGGGILLYGPPGCGKTFIARATAGEVGAQFIAVGIHDIIDKYFGESEKMVHKLFEEARRRAPTVLFFDEFDALGGNRRGGESQFWKTLVDQLLQEMDGIGSRNENVLVFAATNAPWNIDSAFRRPGRFDRTLFVPPPDREARAEMLRRGMRQLPGGENIAVDSLAEATSLFTGADLRSLCERASENALHRSLESGQVHPVQIDDFRQELRTIRSSAEEWLATAKNYARYSNDGGQYDELSEFLKRAKRW